VPLHLAVFLITLSGLIFEVGLTRIYSATIWYHFTFVAVSVALLGWGLGGLAVHLLERRGFVPTLDRAAVLVLIYAVTIPLCLGLIVLYPFRMERLALYFLAPLVPFFLAGMALSMIFDLHRARAGSLYFADLIGASLGAVGIVVLLQWLGGETSLVLASLAPVLAALLLSSRPRMAMAAASTGVVLLLLAVLIQTGGTLRVTAGMLKAMPRHMTETPGTRITQTGWNAYSRIDAVEGFASPYLARLYIDSDAWTNVLEWDGALESVADLSTWYRALPFRFTPNPETLVIGPGGGSDVLVALASGSRRVTAVELNPLMIEFVRHYGARAGHLYEHPDVEVVQAEGRNFISRTDRRFDVIFLGFVDSWASVASGGLSLSENYLYTTEAFADYYDRLTPDGSLVILRWDADIPRLVSNAVALLGAEAAAGRILVLLEARESSDDPPQMIFMLRKRPFTEAETAEIVNTWTQARPVIVPGRHVDATYAPLLSGDMTPADWAAQSPTRVDAVFDDSPFYFAKERPFGMPRRMATGLLWLLLPVLLLLGLFVSLGRPAGQPAAAYGASVVYFACLGFGFIVVELALLQHLTLLVGHPIFTLSLLLCTLLAAGGLGAAMSQRVRGRHACLIVASAGLIYAFALPAAISWLLPLGLGARIAIAVAVTAPLGVAMGIPFPRGLSRAGQGALPAPPFFWGLNGTLSVVGSIATVMIALTLGFQVAMVTGAACYVVAALAAGVIDALPVRP
jgi:SAM-dependent methyltransferase